ncbi:MAG: MFS transporter [Acidimicrobiales bacterium]
MTAGWRARTKAPSRGAEAFVVTPFTRLARTHAFSAAGDALLAVALADSLFFNVDPNDARWKVAAYLVLTIAPFAIVAPFLGPLMDRLNGGHRWMMIGSAAVRAALMFALVRYVQGPLLFPLAFSMLVMGKTYAVAKSALVPSMVPDQEALVRSNARLSVLSGVSAAAAGIPGVILLRFGGSPVVLGLGGALFVIAAVLAMQIPAVKVAPAPAEAEEKAELRSAGIVLAATSMGFLRGVAGFITLLLAFSLRGGIDPGPTSPGVQIGHRVRDALGLEQLDLTSGGAPAWHFGIALAGVGLGGLLGSLGVPRLRRAYSEERILAMALLALAAICALAALATGAAGAFLAGFAVALAGTGGKQSFDAIVQRDAPQANLGRSFSRFESRFQLFWVVGALIPAVLPVPARVGFTAVLLSALVVGISYWFGRRPDPRSLLSRGLDRGDVLERVRNMSPERVRSVIESEADQGADANAAPDAASDPPEAAPAAVAAEAAGDDDPTGELNA